MTATSYEDFDRSQWAARRLARGRAPADAGAPGLVALDDLLEVYGPLAELVADRVGSAEPFVVAVTGSVAVGKSAAAAALAQAFGLDTTRAPVSVVCTDGFLYPNRELVARGILERKGFPESFDHDSLARFLVAVRGGAAEVHAPVYSHATYDIVDGATQAIERPSVLILEGLPFPDDHVDFTVYLDAATPDIEQWYVQRFCGLVADAATDDSSFFHLFDGASPEQTAAIARQVWASINLVNLQEHILPTRDGSDVILVKGPDHAVERVKAPYELTVEWQHGAMSDVVRAENRERVDMLEHVWRSMAELGGSLDEAEWKAPSECPGWSVQDNLVHITALEKFILGDPLPSEDLPEDLPHVKNDVGRSNERWIESRRAWTGADALTEFVAVTDARLAQLRDLDDAGFAADSWTPMGPGTVLQLVGFRLFDSWVHEQDMRGAVDRPGDLDSAAARFSTEMMLEVLPYVIGKKVGAPDGSTVVLKLTGPIVATTAVATTDGRAREIDAVPEIPTVSVSLASDVYARLACGRRDPDEALVTGVVAIDGDVELGGTLVRQLNYMF